MLFKHLPIYFSLLYTGTTIETKAFMFTDIPLISRTKLNISSSNLISYYLHKLFLPFDQIPMKFYLNNQTDKKLIKLTLHILLIK